MLIMDLNEKQNHIEKWRHNREIKMKYIVYEADADGVLYETGKYLELEKGIPLDNIRIVPPLFKLYDFDQYISYYPVNLPNNDGSVIEVSYRHGEGYKVVWVLKQ